MKRALLCLLALTALVFAQAEFEVEIQPANYSLLVQKSAPGELAFGNTLQVVITVTNNGTTPVSAQVVEYLNSVEAVDPASFIYTADESYAQPPYHSWNLSLDSGETAYIYYVVRPLGVGKLSIAPTRVYAGGRTFYSEPLYLEVSCRLDNVCDSSFGESSLLCPSDCPQPKAEELAPPAFSPSPNQTELFPKIVISEENVSPGQTTMGQNASEETKSGPEGAEKSDFLIYLGFALFLLFLIFSFFLAGKRQGKKPKKKKG